MITTLRYKGYKGSVEYCADDKIFFGRVQDIPNNSISYHGDDMATVEQGFHEMVDGYLEDCIEDGIEPYKPVYLEPITITVSQEAFDKANALSNRLNTDVSNLFDKAIRTLEVATA